MPYRSSELPTRSNDAPSEIVYRSQLAEARMSVARASAVVALVVLPASIFLSSIHWLVAVVFVALAAAWIAWQRRRDRGDGIALRLEGTALAVRAEDGDGVDQTIPMVSLRDVELDTRTVQKAMREVRPDGLMTSGAAFAVDESRIVLVVAGYGSLTLTNAYYSHGESLRWMGEIRCFLRGHGWLPEDERAAAE